MDHYGIGAAVKGMLRGYFMGARQTGRTTSLLESLRDGDRVCCATAKEAARLTTLCKEWNLDVHCFVVDPRTPQEVFSIGTAQGRMIFDHRWVEQFYELQLEACTETIDKLQRQTSGFGAAHIETQLRARELAKWQQ